MFAILGWLIFGLIVGALAKLLVPGPNDFRGCLPTVLLGMLGSALGGWLGRAIGMYGEGVQAGGIFMSIIGAVAVLLVYQATFGRRPPL